MENNNFTISGNTGGSTGTSSTSENQNAAALATAGQSSGGDFTEPQLKEMAQWMVEDGNLSPEEVNKLLKADNVDPILVVEKNNNPIAQQIDKDFPAAKPQEFKLPPLIGPNDEYTKKIEVVDKQIRGWLSTAGFTREIGSYIAEETSQVSARYHSMNETEKQIWAQEQRVILEKLWGPDKFAEKLSFGQKLISELENKSPGITHFLESSGAGNSANVIANVVLQAERLFAKTEEGI